MERAANEVVWRDLPVEARELSADELARLPLRKAPVKGSRVVIVEGVDRSPCGGTHPRRTGEVGAIAVLAAQKWGNGARIEFACGGRVLALLRESAERLGQAASALRCAPAEAPEAAARLASEAVARRKDLERLTVALAAAEAERLGPRESPIVEELTPPPGTEAAVWLRAVAQALAGRGRLALLGARGEGRAYLCFARAKGAGPDLGAVLRQAVALLGGKGGGAPELAQGGGPAAEKLPEALEGARAKVTWAPLTPALSPVRGEGDFLLPSQGSSLRGASSFPPGATAQPRPAPQRTHLSNSSSTFTTFTSSGPAIPSGKLAMTSSAASTAGGFGTA